MCTNSVAVCFHYIYIYIFYFCLLDKRCWKFIDSYGLQMNFISVRAYITQITCRCIKLMWYSYHIKREHNGAWRLSIAEKWVEDVVTLLWFMLNIRISHGKHFIFCAGVSLNLGDMIEGNKWINKYKCDILVSLLCRYLCLWSIL